MDKSTAISLANGSALTVGLMHSYHAGPLLSLAVYTVLNMCQKYENCVSSPSCIIDYFIKNNYIILETAGGHCI